MSLNTLAFAHEFIRRYVPRGGKCIDATAGRGRDTALLCELVGESGHVLAFDIQPEALAQTAQRLQDAGFTSRCTLLQQSHAELGQYADENSIDCIVFNFGYLPGGDHTIYTHAESSIAALKAGLRVLKPGGVMSLSIYHGGDTGYAERDALLAFLEDIDPQQYTVLVSRFVNRPHDPPIPVFIWKEA